ncbi:ADP-ribosylation factor [Collybia nuda]|uniref:ADP-ribosylation factor n=1 Tax=Collybia nuda TaxID=64659 RepID=A0A9P5Y429_9AGAR|nr:ADP-ribosylation factor [Collybia nuda]
MSTILRRFMNRFYRNNEYSITIAGLGYTGKTTMLYLLKLNEIVQTISSIGFNVESIEVPLRGGGQLNFTGWDVGTGCGNPSVLSMLIGSYTASADALIWVVDSTDREGLKDSVGTLQDVIRRTESERSEAGTPAQAFPILILANKQDLPEAQSIDTVRKAFATLLRGRNACVFKSAFTQPDTGLQDAFEWLSIALELASAGKLPQPPKHNPVADMRSVDTLTEKLESWLGRIEKDSNPQEFLDQFHSISLPAWDHYTHIRIAFLLLRTHGRQKGKDMIFSGIEKYITESSQTRGRTFHITMTYFWIQIVHLGIESKAPQVPLKFSNGSSTASTSSTDFEMFLLCNPYVADGNLWADFYSRDVMMSPAAKAGMVLPDKKPLPNLVIRDAI